MKAYGAHVTIYDKSWRSPETVCDHSKPGRDDHRYRCDRLKRQTELRRAVLRLLRSQTEHQNYR